jgi:Flp pilus assembly protein TadG
MYMSRVFRFHQKSVETGASLVEFSIAGTVFFMALFGVLEVSRLLWVHNALTEAARGGSRYAVLNSANETVVKNMVVFGNTAGTGQPSIPGLTTGMVTVTYSDPYYVKTGTATVTISGYTFAFSVPVVGSALNLPVYKSTMTAESVGTDPSGTPTPTPTPPRICGTGENPTANNCVCPSGTSANSAGTACVINCPSGYSPNAAGTACVINCPNGYSPNAAGDGCVINCPSGYIPNAAGDGCVINCPSGYIPNSAGTACVINCPTNYVPDANGTACVLRTCGTNEGPGRGPTFTCACPPGTRPNGNGTRCN